MNGLIAIVVAANAFFLAENQPGREQFTLTPDGRWEKIEQPVAAPTASVADADVRLAEIQKRIDNKQFGSARGDLVRWLLANPSSPNRDRGLLMMARTLVGQGDRIRAFYYCDELLDTYPESPVYAEALQLQFEIADLYLNGARDRLLGLPILDQNDAAVEMLFRIQQRSPGSPLADRSLVRTADFYWSDGQFDLAADTYGFYAQSYPRSPLTPSVRVREAYSNLAQFKGARYDPAPILNAKTQMNSIKAEYPDLAKTEDLDSKIESANRQLARRMYLNADFYRRTNKPKSAEYLAKRLIATYPNLPEAQDAAKLLEKLSK
jgi:outer membrane assembly lipoprotein YfiO